MQFDIPDMSCGHCVARITEAIKQADPAAQVDVDLSSKRVAVNSTALPDALTAAIAEAGYTASRVD
ncbi:heavy-metal-associated domain-containing protein [Chitinasiproducens palmae]|uniref:Copper chaperone n=1 Tax=Chitinasiproducens palmae TaxID=1770053 RepID=A0A1H2PKK2_9BURK|nr:heavy-metal-associated domain-containing protein [Chitinasiproducens palmae]SDV46095.1 copper chaperone [Chitinasiproducens palmae]